MGKYLVATTRQKSDHSDSLLSWEVPAVRDTRNDRGERIVGRRGGQSFSGRLEIITGEAATGHDRRVWHGCGSGVEIGGRPEWRRVTREEVSVIDRKYQPGRMVLEDDLMIACPSPPLENREIRESRRIVGHIHGCEVT